MGTPVEPDVYITTATSSLVGPSTGTFTKKNKNNYYIIFIFSNDSFNIPFKDMYFEANTVYIL